jgi:putative RNA 2'-phosphotransferase
LTTTRVRTIEPTEEELFTSIGGQVEEPAPLSRRTLPVLKARKPSLEDRFVCEMEDRIVGALGLSPLSETQLLLEPPRVAEGENPESVLPGFLTGVLEALTKRGIAEVSASLDAGRPETAALAAIYEGAGLAHVQERDVWQRDLTDFTPGRSFDPLIYRSMAMAGEEPFVRLLREVQKESLERGDGDARREFDRLSSLEPFTPNTWVMALDLNTPVGLVLVQVDEDLRAGNLLYVGVVPSHRGKGIGRALHEKGLSLLRGHRVTSYTGYSDVQNEPMARIFEENGCVKIRRERVYRIHLAEPPRRRPVRRESGKQRGELSQDQQEALSRFMAYILRHHPDEFGLSMDDEGFVPFPDFMHVLSQQRKWRFLGPEHVRSLVEGTENERFEITSDKIRCRYGHSMKTRIRYPEIEPKHDLYFGTTSRSLSKILKVGLVPVGRQYVHLSNSIEEARAVGERHDSNAVVIAVKAPEAHRRGITFYKATEKIILVNEIPPEFIEPLSRS